MFYENQKRTYLMQNFFISKIKTIFSFFDKQKSLTHNLDNFFHLENLLPYNALLENISSYSLRVLNEDYLNSTVSILEYLENQTFYTEQPKSINIYTAKYGSPIELVFGENILPGKIIWIDQTKTKLVPNYQKNSIQKNYQISFAMAICEGEISEIKNILYYNNTILDQNNFSFNIYKGTEDQNPDPLIQSVEKIAPAFRGLAYIVFKDFPISEFKNKIPNLYFHVKRIPNIWNSEKMIINKSSLTLSNIIREISSKVNIEEQILEFSESFNIPVSITFCQNISGLGALNLLKLTYDFESFIYQKKISFKINHPETKHLSISIQNLLKNSNNGFFTVVHNQNNRLYNSVNLHFLDCSLNTKHMYLNLQNTAQPYIKNSLHIKLPIILEKFEAYNVGYNIIKELSKEAKIITIILNIEYINQIFPSKILGVKYLNITYYLKIISIKIKLSKLYVVTRLEKLIK